MFSPKLVLQLSLFGLAMGVATVFVIPSTIEPVFWLPIFVATAALIARHGQRPFLHGVAVGAANCFWITSAHVAFAATYLAHHPQEAEMMKSMPLPDSPRLMMAMTGPVIGLISGIVIGVFAIAATKIASLRSAPAVSASAA